MPSASVVALCWEAHFEAAHVLAGAVEDFSVTIEEMPAYADAWMRRGQARAAMGEDGDALQDFEQCLKLTSETPRKVRQHSPYQCNAQHVTQR